MPSPLTFRPIFQTFNTRYTLANPWHGKKPYVGIDLLTKKKAYEQTMEAFYQDPTIVFDVLLQTGAVHMKGKPIHLYTYTFTEMTHQDVLAAYTGDMRTSELPTVPVKVCDDVNKRDAKYIVRDRCL